MEWSNHVKLNNLTLNFGINNEYDLFNKLKRDLDKLLNEASIDDHTKTIDNTYNFLITAYHLSYDWTKNVKYKRKKEKIPKSFKDLLTAIRFLANCSKHRELTKYLNENTVENITEPIVGNYWDYMYGNQVYITINGIQESISILSEPLMKYFEWLLDDSKKLDEMPDEVKNFKLMETE